MLPECGVTTAVWVCGVGIFYGRISFKLTHVTHMFLFLNLDDISLPSALRRSAGRAIRRLLRPATWIRSNSHEVTWCKIAFSCILGLL